MVKGDKMEVGNDGLTDKERQEQALAIGRAKAGQVKADEAAVQASIKASEGASEDTKGDDGDKAKRDGEDASQRERDAADAKAWREHQAGLAAKRTSRDDDDEDGRRPPPAAVAARDNLMRATGMSQADAEKAIAAVYASQNEHTEVASGKALGPAFGAPVNATQVPDYSPQNRTADNRALDGSRIDPQASIAAGIVGTPPYSPQTLGPDGRALGKPGTPAIPEDGSVPSLAGSERTLDSIRQGDEAMVPFRVPRRFKLVLDDHSHVWVPSGFVRIPEHLAEHRWIKLNGATREG